MNNTEKNNTMTEIHTPTKASDMLVLVVKEIPKSVTKQNKMDLLRLLDENELISPPVKD